ncbi:MAG: hypothetical protein ACREVK_07415 [Gammaproteobacteria bacterium]
MDHELEYLNRLLEDSRVVELRHQDGKHWRSRLFDDAGEVLRAIDELSDRGNLYCSINRPSDGITPSDTFRNFGGALGNDDIETITRIPLDFDPRRLSGANSTDAELNSALECWNRFVSALSASGWPMPLLGMSGNGAHAVYRCSIKATPASQHWFAVLYSGLRQRFSGLFETHNVIFDTSVRNPGRIWRLYGTTNRKGPHSEEHPQRTSGCVLPAGAWQTVKAKQVQGLAEAMREKVVVDRRCKPRLGAIGKGDYTSLDVVSWFASHGLYIGPQGGDGVHAVVCPWKADHSCESGRGETVIFQNVGRWPSFYCHAHCEGRDIKDVMELFGDADSFCREQFPKEESR